MSGLWLTEHVRLCLHKGQYHMAAAHESAEGVCPCLQLDHPLCSECTARVKEETGKLIAEAEADCAAYEEALQRLQAEAAAAPSLQAGPCSLLLTLYPKSQNACLKLLPCPG